MQSETTPILFDTLKNEQTVEMCEKPKATFLPFNSLLQTEFKGEWH